MARGKSQGIQSNQKREVGYRHGTPRREINKTGVMQLGTMQGSHITGDGESLKEHKVVQPLKGGAGYPSDLGNYKALTTVAGPGGSRAVYRNGSQAQQGPAAQGNPPPAGQLFPGWEAGRGRRQP